MKTTPRKKNENNEEIFKEYILNTMIQFYFYNLYSLCFTIECI